MDVIVPVDVDIQAAVGQLSGQSALDRLRWAVDRFGDGAVLLSSMQKTASVLMHMFSVLGLRNDIVFGDTGFHFHETLRFRDDFIRSYGVNVVTLYPALTPEQQEKEFGRKLYQSVDGQPICCRMRKEEPFLAYMRETNRKCAIVGARRGDGGRRAQLEPLSIDPRFGGVALHPLFDWTRDQVALYLEQHAVPVHPLHSQGYPSIGCECCTTPVQPGEDPRAGRWRHLRQPGDDGPGYCGINFTDGSGI